MTEEEWLAYEDPKVMHGALTDQRWCRPCGGSGEVKGGPCPSCVSQRKSRLVACAFWRLLWDELEDDSQRRAVAMAERYAEGRASQQELWQAWYRTTSLGA